jgi:hypothetical protein
MNAPDLAKLILSIPFKRRIEPVDVPEWGETAKGRIHVRSLNALEEDQYARIITGADIEDGVAKAARLVAHFTCDETGALIFAGDEALRALSNGSAAALSRIIDKFSEMREGTKPAPAVGGVA